MSSQKKERFPTIIYRLICAVVRLMSLIPLPVGQFLGRIIGGVFAVVPMRRTRICMENLRNAFGNSMTETEIRKINRRIGMHFGQMVFEVAHILRLDHAMLHKCSFRKRGKLSCCQGQRKGCFHPIRSSRKLGTYVCCIRPSLCLQHCSSSEAHRLFTGPSADK